ncbi:ATP-binding protein [Methanoculleus chikugoensis]|uniref:ATP-binding protein n=1 Tax=Methanoculleus chikugoensis TaxID=118126 RepID=UPI0006D0B1E1|nr:ATP-binding protein [Methanoculleus chikugoensis]
MPDAVKPTLFARFAPGEKQQERERLGLYITRTLIERYGGRVWVDDRVPGRPPECGAAFRFTLPRRAGDRNPPAPPATSTACPLVTARP